MAILLMTRPCSAVAASAIAMVSAWRRVSRSVICLAWWSAALFPSQCSMGSLGSLSASARDLWARVLWTTIWPPMVSSAARALIHKSALIQVDPVHLWPIPWEMTSTTCWQSIAHSDWGVAASMIAIAPRISARGTVRYHPSRRPLVTSLARQSSAGCRTAAHEATLNLATS